MRTRIFGLCVATATLASCGGEAGPGEDGGDCKLGADACDRGLVCEHGACVPDEQAGDLDRPWDFRFSAESERRTLEADGRDAITVRLRLTQTDGTPFVGALLARANPFQAAKVHPPLLAFTEGEAVVRVTACDAAKGPCPERFVLDLARNDRPTEIFARTAPFELEGTEPVVGPGGEGGGGVAGGRGDLLGLSVPGGQQCVGDQWRVRIRGGELPQGEEDWPETLGTSMRRRAIGDGKERLELLRDGEAEFWIDFPDRPVKELNYPSSQLQFGHPGGSCRPEVSDQVVVVLDRSGNAEDTGYVTIFLYSGVVECDGERFELCANYLR